MLCKKFDWLGKDESRGYHCIVCISALVKAVTTPLHSNQHLIK